MPSTQSSFCGLRNAPRFSVKLTGPGAFSQEILPPIPTPSSGINNSNLAAGTLPGSRNLAITQPQANGPTSLTAGSKDSTATVPAKLEPIVQPVPRDNVPVVPASNWDNKGQQTPPADPLLTQQPTAANPPPAGNQPTNNRPGLTWPNVNLGSNPPPAAAPVTPAATNNAAPVDQLQSQLKSRGVTWQRAENVAGGVKFSCIVPNPQNPQVSRAYEAIGPDYPAAVRAVLWEIDNRK